MSETSHLKCPCLHCGGSIEFPASGLGLSAVCPHCGETTELFVPPMPEVPGASAAVTDPSLDAHPSDDAAHESQGGDAAASALESNEGAVHDKPPASRLRLLWIAVPLVVLVGAAALFVFRGRTARPPSPDASDSSSTTNPEGAKITPGVQANLPPSAKTPKSIGDLKVGTITLEKTKGSSLTYAVGVLRNDSEHQRFGLNIELELTDARGNKAGTAKDYRAVLEPRQEWRFRALVLDSKAVSARVANIREEE